MPNAGTGIGRTSVRIGNGDECRTGQADPATVDMDIFVRAVEGGFGVRGAHIGGEGDQPELFREDMLAFHCGL